MAYISGSNQTGVYVNDPSIGALAVTSSGTGSTADIWGYEDGVHIHDGNIGSLTVTASGTASRAYIYGEYDNGVRVTSGDIGALNVVASGIAGDAYIWGDDHGINIENGNLDTVTVTASNKDAYAGISSYYDAAVRVYGDVGNVAVTASGTHSTADINAVDDGGLWVAGDVNSVKIVASGASSTAYIGHFGATNTIWGNLGSVAVTASGGGSDAELYDTIVDGNIGPVAVSATGAGSYAEARLLQFNSTSQTVGPVTLTASGGGDAEFFYEGIGTLSTIDASAAAHSTVDIRLHLHDGVTPGTGQQSGVITGTGAGNLDLTLYGHSITSLDAGAMTGNVTMLVDNPTEAVEGMDITTGTGVNHIQVGDGEGTYGSGFLFSVVNTIHLNGMNNEIDFSNLFPVENALNVPIDTVSEVISGFVSHSTNAATGDYIAFDTATNGTAGPSGNFVGGVGGLLNVNISLTTLLVDVIFAANTNIHFAAGTIGGDSYIFSNLGDTGANTHTDQIVELVGVTNVTASDIHHA